MRHDPIPDGRSGPFMRKPHAKVIEGEQLVVDPRCGACAELIDRAMALNLLKWEDRRHTVASVERRIEQELRYKSFQETIKRTKGDYGAGI